MNDKDRELFIIFLSSYCVFDSDWIKINTLRIGFIVATGIRIKYQEFKSMLLRFGFECKNDSINIKKYRYE